MALASALVNILSLALPLAMLQIFDRIIPHQSTSTLGLLIGGVGLAVLLEAAIRSARNYITGWVGACFEHRLGCAAFGRLLDANISEFEKEGPTVHLERLRAAGLVRDFYSGQAILSLFDLPFVAVYLTVIGMLAGWLVVVPVGVLLCFVAAAGWNARHLRDFAHRRTDFEERRFSFVAQTLVGIHSVKTMAMEAMMQRRYEMLQNTNVNQTFDGSRHSILALNIGALFSQISTVALVAAGASQVVLGDLTPGALAACITLAGRCLSPLQGVLATWIRFQGLLVAQQQIDKLLAIPPAANADAPALPAIKGGLALEDVTYGFPGAKKPVLAGLSLTVQPGECIAIQGDSGSGKSSLLEMMAGLQRPSAGRVLVDGMDLAGFSPSSLPQQIGYLPQQGTLLQGTLLENITMFRPHLDARAMQVARAIGLDTVVAGMRNGYATMVGAGAGDSVPAGVRQRISIARALVHDPQIILFDEANIALDGSADDALRDYLAGLKGSRTMVLVTHRPSLLRLADRVLYLDDGQLSDAAPAPLAALGHAEGHSPARPGASDDLHSSLMTRLRTLSDLSLCLPKMLAALQWEGTSQQFAEALPHMAETLDLDLFRKVMATLGYGSRRQRGNLARCAAPMVPCLFLPDRGDAMVVLAVEDAGLRVFDGGTGQIRRMPADSMPGQFYQFRAVEGAQGGADRARWIASVLARFRPLMGLAFALTIVTNLLTLTVPSFVMVVYDRIIPSGDVLLIPYLLIGLAIALAADWLVRGFRARLLSYMGARGEYIIGTSIFQKILALPAAATEQVPVGSQVARIKDFESLRDLFVGPLALLFYELPGTLLFIFVLGLVNGWLILVLLGALVVYSVFGLLCQPWVAAATLASSRAGAARQEFLSDTLFKMRGVKSAGVEDVWYERYRRLSDKAIAGEFRSQQVSAMIATAAQTIGTLTALAVITTAVLCVFANAAPAGSIVAAMILTWRLVTPLQNGFMSLATIARALRSVRQIDNLMRLQAERESAVAKPAVPRFKGDIAFNRASFRYSNEADPALLGVTLHIEPGQVAGIAGPNGSGKSTLLKLVTGLYMPQAGSVRIDNVDIRQMDPAGLRGLVSYAPQRCDVFYGTVAQNLRLSNPTATDDEVRWATRLAGLYDDIMAMPEAFNTRLLDGQGDQLPLGFRQRLSLARAYLKPAPVMILDEPGNGLDAEGDKAFLEALDRLRRTTTILFVSHRPSHLRVADQVIYIQDGYVRQVGSFDQVAKLAVGGAR